MYHQKYNYSKHKQNIKINHKKWKKKTLKKIKISSQKQLLINNTTPTYKFLIKQEFLEDQIPLTSTKKIKVFENEFIKRGNWVKFNENSPPGETIDFLYTDGKYFFDKSLYKYNKILTTVINMKDDNHSISDKYNLIENLKKTDINTKHLLDQYHINMYNIYKNKLIIENYKPLFDKYKVLIFKPIHGLKGENIQTFDNFDNFSKFINDFLVENNSKLQKFVEEKYNQLGVELKYYQYNIEWVLQEYIINPMLFKNLKFHLRGHFVYYKPLNKEKEGYIQDNMTLFTAKKPYKLSDYDNKDIHDTHYKSTLEGITFKNNLIQILGKEKSKDIMDQIIHIFGNVLKVINAKCYPESQNCFNIFGFDIIITSDYIVKIIETNFIPGSPRIDLLQNIMTEIVDPLFPPKNKTSKLKGLIKL
jgi:hypothetical protein